MYKRSQNSSIVIGFSFLAFVFGVVYMIGHTREVFGIISSFVQFEQHSYFNISNFAYCLIAVAHVLLPMAIMYPHKNMLDKKDMLKVLCYAMAIIYLAANLWLIQWFLQCAYRGEWSFDVAQFLKQENMMFNHMQWASRNGETIFYNHISAMIWLLMGYYFDRDRKKTCILLVAQMVMAYVVPTIGYYIYRNKMIPDWWLKKTMPILCMDIIFTAVMFNLSKNRDSWIKYVCPLIRKRRRKRIEETDGAQETAGQHK